MLRVKHCINCNSIKFNLLFISRDQVSNENYSYYGCLECGLKFIYPIPTKKRLQQIYSMQSNELEKKSNGLLYFFLENPVFKSFFNLFGRNVNVERADFVETHLMHLKKRGRLLDVGSGAGRFVNELNNRGWNVEGIEFSEKNVKLAKKLFGSKLQVKCFQIENFRIKPDTEAITFWHVFEHISDFQKVIKYISKKIKKKSCLILETPNASALSVMFFKNYSPLLLTPEHITFWSRESYLKLAGQYGFKVQEVSYPKTFLFTTASAAYNLIYKKFHNNFLALPAAVVFLTVSLPLYLLVPKLNESIRVVLIKK